MILMITNSFLENKNHLFSEIIHIYIAVSSKNIKKFGTFAETF